MQILVDQIKKEFDLSPLTRREGNFVLFDNKVIGDYNGHVYGVAADIGTTTIVLHLIDLEMGAVLIHLLLRTTEKD